MYIFHDDSGKLQPGKKGFFCSGLLFVRYPHKAYSIIKQIRHRYSFYEELHFHKISEKRAPIYVNVILSALNSDEVSFYGMFVNNERVTKKALGRKEYIGINRVVKSLMTKSAMDISERVEAVVFTDSKSRVRQDNFLDYLKDKGTRETPKLKVKDVIPLDSKSDDLIQACDLVAGSVRDIWGNLEIRSKWRQFVLDQVLESLTKRENVRIWEWGETWPFKPCLGDR